MLFGDPILWHQSIQYIEQKNGRIEIDFANPHRQLMVDPEFVGLVFFIERDEFLNTWQLLQCV